MLNVLIKFTSKDEPPVSRKGKARLELPNFEDLSLDELHEGYLTRLSTSHNMEAGMVRMMKKKFEV